VSLLSCPHCGKPISASARSCPHCGADPKLPLVEKGLPCRVCGTLLKPSAHRVAGSISGFSQSPITATVVGSTVTVQGGGVSFWRTVTVWHSPCSQCGEPKPLRRLIDISIFAVLWKVGLLFVGLAFTLMCVFFFIALSRTIRGPIVIAVWLAVMAAVRWGGDLPYGKQTRHVRV